MDIPVGASVHCTDGLCGRSTYVLINPVQKEITHLVVKEEASPHTERMVPVADVKETAADVILLRYSKEELDGLDPFIEEEYIREDLPDPESTPGGFNTGAGGFMMWPYATPTRTETVRVETKHIPMGELAIKRGTPVEATDGHVGQVDEFLVDPCCEHVTHLVLREGHLWGQKDISIPVDQIDRMEEGTVYLKLNKREIEALPAIPAHRW
jgi:sporulation protein YlmC with PRC-barrel domain